MDVHLTLKVGADWNAPGQRLLLPTPGQNKKRFIAAAWQPESRELIVVDSTSEASDLFITLGAQRVDLYRYTSLIHLVVDNYLMRRSKKTQEALGVLNGRIVVHFLGPYCLEDNAIERVWWNLHAAVIRNHTCESIEELLENAYDYIANYSQHGPAKASVAETHMCRT